MRSSISSLWGQLQKYSSLIVSVSGKAQEAFVMCTAV